MLSLATRMMTVGIDYAQLAFTGGELAVASATVIAERVGMMAEVARDPIGADYAEFDRMISEKIVAFAASGAALSDAWWRSQRHLGDFLVDLGDAMMSPRPPSGTELFERASAHHASVAESAVRAAGSALAPLHRSARANARRLTRKRR
ncbi:MAG: hypothetical protein JWL84_40 [Rhodospirillales bacterium]|nr:hypothetical protein [Rhodospirillales bacterium]